ncbi:MAG: lamin tail domain-containing protein [Verrucomicrobiota bacterium]
MKQKFFPVPRVLLPMVAGLKILTASAPATPVISEFLALNPGPETDDQGLRSDWIEIHNPDAAAVNLEGWSLTDDFSKPGKWVFPGITLQPGQYLVVRASGLNRRDPAGPLHTNFSLKASGGDLGLFTPTVAGASIRLAYPRQFAGISHGQPAGGTADVWFTGPTPGAENAAAGLTDYVRDTHFSLPRGFLNAPASVTVTVDTPGAEIRYTLDGSEPGPASPLLTAPLPLATTTVLRVRGFKAGMVPANTDTRTWIFPSAWISQPDSPAGFPPVWGNPLKNGNLDPVLKVLADYGMDSGVTSDPGIRAALTETLPVVCVSGSVEDLFGTDGINGNGRRTGAEKAVAVEYFNPADPADRFSARATLQAHGGGVKEFAKKAFRLDFSGPEADGALHYPLFAGSSSEVFDQLVLRSGGHDSFTVAPAAGLNKLDEYDLAGHGSYLRDQFLRRTENEMGLLSPRGRYVHLCLNGLYWGLYDLHERPNARYAAGYRGGEEADWDVIHHPQTGTSQQVVDGDDASWNDMQALASGASTPQDFAALKTLMGPSGLIDHLLARIWAGDFDWLGPAYMPGNDGVNPTGNIAFYQNKNWYALRRTRGEAPGPWQFFTWDAEISMGSHLLRLWAGASKLPDNFSWPRSQRQLNFDFTAINRPNTPAAPWAALLQDPEFRLQAADRMRRHFYNNGALSPRNAQARVAAMIQELDAPILAESARWGDVSGWTITNLPGVGLVSGWKNQRITRADFWRPETAWLRDIFAVQRGGIVVGQFRARGVYPAVEPADITPFGGALGAAGKITLTTPETAAVLYYTTDGTDPRVTGTGAVSATAVAAAGPVTPPAAPSFALKTRVLKAGVWSALTEAAFSSAVPPAAADLAITEIHYHPSAPTPAEVAAGFTDGDLFEFLEITNRSPRTVALGSLRFAAGIDFDFATGGSVQELAPGASLLLASDRAGFVRRYGFEPAGVFANGTRLANSGEQIKLVTADGTVIAGLTYSDQEEWPMAADGYGKSLTLLAPASGSDGSTAAQWRAAPPTPGTVAVNLTFAEWLTDFFNPEELGDSRISAPLADPDGDGLANILEYLTVSHPRRISPNPVTVSQPEPGKIRFEWPLRPDATGSLPELRLSPDLKTWTGSGGATTVPTTTGIILQRLDQPAPAGPRFARLTVTP